MRLAFGLLSLVTILLGGIVWHGIQLIGARNDTIASLGQLVESLKAENELTGKQSAGVSAAELAGGGTERTSALEARFAELRSENERLLQELTQLRNRSTAAQADLTEAEERASTSADTLRNRLDEERSKLDQAEKRTFSLENRIEILESELRSALAGRIDPQIATTDIGSLQVEMTMLLHERDAARTQIDLLLQENAMLQETLAASGDTISVDQHNTEINELSQQVTLLETDLTDTRARAALLEGRVNDTRDAGQEELQAAARARDELAVSLSASKARNQQLLSANEELNGTLARLEAALADREQALAEAATRQSQEAQQTTQPQIDKLFLQRNQAQEALATATKAYQAESAELSATIERLRAELTTQQTHLHEAQSTQEELQIERKTSKTETDHLVLERDQALEKLEAVRVEHLAEATELTASLERRDAELKELHNSLDAVKTTERKLKAELETTRSLNESLFSSDDLLTAASEAARTVEERYTSDIAVLEQRFKELQGERARLVLERDNAIKQGAHLNKQIAQLREERSTIMRASDDVVQATEQERDTLQARFEEQLEEILMANEELGARNQDLNSKLDAARADIGRLQATEAELSDQRQLVSDLAAINQTDAAMITQEDVNLDLAEALADLMERNQRLERIVADNSPQKPSLAPRDN